MLTPSFTCDGRRRSCAKQSRPASRQAFANGDKLLVRQTLDQLLVLCGCAPPHLAAKFEPEEI